MKNINQLKSPKSVPSIAKSKEPDTPFVFDLNAKNKSIKWNADGSYPYSKKINLLEYEQQKHELQIELLKMQSWARETSQRIVIIYSRAATQPVRVAQSNVLWSI